MTLRQISKKVRGFVMKMKIAMQRTNTYLALANSGMIVFLVLSKLKETGYIDYSLGIYFPLIYLAGVGILLLIGFVEIHYLRGISEEARQLFKLNPFLSDMYKRIINIEKKLDKQIKEKKK